MEWNAHLIIGQRLLSKKRTALSKTHHIKSFGEFRSDASVGRTVWLLVATNELNNIKWYFLENGSSFWCTSFGMQHSLKGISFVGPNWICWRTSMLASKARQAIHTKTCCLHHQQKLIEIHMMHKCENMHAETSADVCSLLVHLPKKSVDLKGKDILNVYIASNFHFISSYFVKLE